MVILTTIVETLSDVWMGTMNLHTRRSRGVAARIAVLLAAAVAVAPAVRAADVAAGTIITNTASAQYTLGATTEIQTATAAFTVDQLVNVTVTWQNSTDVSVLAGSVQQTLLFQLTNTGNGPDSYTLSASVQPPAAARSRRPPARSTTTPPAPASSLPAISSTPRAATTRRWRRMLPRRCSSCATCPAPQLTSAWVRCSSLPPPRP